MSHKERQANVLSTLCGITGYSPEYIEEVLHKKKAERANATLAIDLHRPTFIKVNRKYLHPDTLDHYGLPWEWDAVSFALLLPFAPSPTHSLTDLSTARRRVHHHKTIHRPLPAGRTVRTYAPTEGAEVDHGAIRQGDHYDDDVDAQ